MNRIGRIFAGAGLTCLLLLSSGINRQPPTSASSVAPATAAGPRTRGAQTGLEALPPGVLPVLASALQTSSGDTYLSKPAHVPGGLRAANPKGNFETAFEPEGAVTLAGEAGGASHTFGLQALQYQHGTTDERVTPGAWRNDAARVERTLTTAGGAQLVEWYVNSPLGLEQGFIVDEPGSAESEIALTLAVTGSQRWQARTEEAGITWADESGASRWRYGTVKAWDAAGRSLAARVELLDGALRLRVDADQAVFPVTIDPVITFLQKLTAGDGAGGDQFGYSVAAGGDTVVVGAPFDTVDGTFSQGSASVFVRNGGVWTEQQRLTASDGAAVDWFGFSVAISGDTIVVGAMLDTVGANTFQGSASVFVRSGGVWTEQQKLTASDGAADDQFGVSVAISGDTIVAGALYDDIGANLDQGSASVFVRSGGIWTEQQKLTASDGAFNDQIGSSVAVGGDTIVAGAPFDDVGSNADQGSAHVFVRSGGVWTEQQKLTASDGSSGDKFGGSVAVTLDTIVAGAPYDIVGSNARQGSASVFVRSGGVWTEQQRLTASDGASNDQFGSSVAVSGDTIVAGAPFDDVGSNADQGSAHVFVRSGGVWTEQQKLTASDGASADYFGVSVAVTLDTIGMGAYRDDVGSNADQGSAYVFGPPTVDAGADVDVTSGPFGYTLVTLNGTVTGDLPDSVRWSIGSTTLGSFEALSANFPVGINTVTFSATFAGETISDDVVVSVRLATNTGPEGPQGPAGPAGETGAQGLQGEIGPQGPVGPTGEAGAQGLQGEIGPQGPAGPSGATGAQGPAGPAGATGAQGSQGEIGPQGSMGPSGETGAQGLQGEIGPHGPAGPSGATGAQGPAGPTGATGEQGLQGEIGPQGPVGPTGATGAQGSAGPAGATGPQGPSGPTGATGPQGPTGPSGEGLVSGSLLLMPQGQAPPPGYRRLGSFVEEAVDSDGRGGQRPFRLTIVIWQKL